ncbi:hypothetical protein FALBO_4298 [Fusarium albosuccineum]|uniref:F-box domain-containing protein n=1 Tax=Fusarium albosuccineum TaxID=1237068 RepID=A0A8H4LJJ2_9HYPO|nr:hypothetical protein FALBO_4298 [Fusarium albosuccineum]
MLPRGLTALPTELISRMIDLADPATHLDIACTCRRLLECSKDVLEHHKQAHQKYKVVSDRDPATIPTLLRSASGLTSPIDAWHIRSLEIWGSRWEWNEWRPWKLRPGPAGRRCHAFDHSRPLEWSISRSELAHYLKSMREELRLPEELVNSARVAFDQGNDSVAQMLLIVLCPRLQSLKFIYNRHDKVGKRRSLHWLTFVIARSLLDDSWPPGLQNLQEVAVGVHSETCFNDDVVGLWYTRTSFTAILRLPSIKSVYFRGLRPEDKPTIDGEPNDDYDPDHEPDPASTEGLTHSIYRLPLRCSTVENLYLESIGDYDTFTQDLAEAPKALKTYTLHSGELELHTITDFDILLESFVHNQKESLESIMVYDAGEFQGYRCTLYQLGSEIDVSELPLRQIHLQLDDLVHNASFWFDSKPWYRSASAIWEDETQRQICVDLVAGLFPASLEVLVLGCCDYAVRLGGDMRMEEDILIKIIESGKLPALKAIYIHQPDSLPVDAFKKLPEVGWDNGVDVHVKSNLRTPRHQVQFPMAPQAKSYLAHREIIETEFDPFSGRWVVPGQQTEQDNEAEGLPAEHTTEDLDSGGETDDDIAELLLQW